MQVAFHIGAHCTDDDQLLKCLLVNKDLLARERIVIPGPSRYRSILREALKALAGSVAPQEIQDAVLEAAMDVDDADRIVFSNENFVCTAQMVLSGGRFYEKARDKTKWLRNIFPGNSVEFFFAMRDPATFVPAIFKSQDAQSPEAFLADFDPMNLRWSEVVKAIRNSNPDCPITVWCNEDTPLLWPEILQELSGHGPGTKLEGADALLASIMSQEGMRRMTAYVAAHPPVNKAQNRRIAAAFLGKFALDEALEEELDMPGWTEDYVRALTARYEEDMFEVAGIRDVRFLTP